MGTVLWRTVVECVVTVLVGLRTDKWPFRPCPFWRKRAVKRVRDDTLCGSLVVVRTPVTGRTVDKNVPCVGLKMRDVGLVGLLLCPSAFDNV